jgi:hypothetical protein
LAGVFESNAESETEAPEGTVKPGVAEIVTVGNSWTETKNELVSTAVFTPSEILTL